MNLFLLILALEKCHIFHQSYLCSGWNNDANQWKRSSITAVEFPALLLPSCWWNMCPWRGKKFNTVRRENFIAGRKVEEVTRTSSSKGSYFSTWRPVCLYFHSYLIVLHDTNFSPNKSTKKMINNHFYILHFLILENLHNLTYFKLSSNKFRRKFILSLRCLMEKSKGFHQWILKSKREISSSSGRLM